MNEKDENQAKTFEDDEDKPLENPNRLIGRLAGTDAHSQEIKERRSNLEKKAGSEAAAETGADDRDTGREKRSAVKENTKRKPSAKKPAKKAVASAAAGKPKQMNITIRRSLFRDMQPLLTEMKLHADEQLEKTVTLGNFFEVLLILGLDQFETDPHRVKAELVKLLE